MSVKVFPVKKKAKPVEANPTFTVRCPVCHGHGGWKEATGFHNFPWQPISCSQCNGWGWVAPGKDAECIHEMKEISPARTAELGYHHYGMFCHFYECSKCGRVTGHDSSG